MKKIAAVVALTFAFSGLLGGCGGPVAEVKPSPVVEAKPSAAAPGGGVKLAIAHVLADTHPTNQALLMLKEKIETGAPGKFNVEIASNGKLGAEKALVQKLQEGTIEMAAVTTGTLASIDPQFGIFDLPYLIKDAKAADAIMDGDIGKEMIKIFDKYGLVGLAAEENGFRQLSANKEIRIPSDMKNVKIRTMQNEVHIKYFTKLGAKPAPLDFTQLYQALRTGAFEAQDNPLANTALSKLYEVQKYVIQTDYVYSPIFVLASKVFWNKISDAEKKVIADNAFELRIKQRELNRGEQTKYIDAITKGGAKYITLTDAEKAKWKAEAESLYSEYEAKIGKDLLAKVRTAGGF